MTYETWEMRKHAVKQLGETASAKLIFPLMLMFLLFCLLLLPLQLCSSLRGFKIKQEGEAHIWLNLYESLLMTKKG